MNTFSTKPEKSGTGAETARNEKAEKAPSTGEERFGNEPDKKAQDSMKTRMTPIPVTTSASARSTATELKTACTRGR